MEWILSPAYNINPSIDKHCLAMNMDTNSNALNYDPAKGVGEYFEHTIPEMDAIVHEVNGASKVWQFVDDTPLHSLNTRAH